MKTEVGVVRGVKEEEVFNKRFNLYMGISLNNKWFTKEHISKYILWGLKNTKERFGIVVADTLQVTNYRVRSKYARKIAVKKALEEGDKFVETSSICVCATPLLEFVGKQ